MRMRGAARKKVWWLTIGDGEERGQGGGARARAAGLLIFGFKLNVVAERSVKGLSCRAPSLPGW